MTEEKTTFEFEGRTYELKPEFEKPVFIEGGVKGPDIGRQIIEEIVYADKFRKGYEFGNNLRIDGVKEQIRMYKAKGLEVFVGRRAFGRDGTEYPKMKTILVRGNRNC